jgi:putative two-component system response regulator
MSGTAPTPEPTTILVVDDEAGIRQALDRFLRRVGYRVVTAESGAAALERLASDRPDAMLSDIRMPNMTGVELVPKALAAQPDLAIIMLTAIDSPKTAIECLRLGAYDYLIKPLDLEELELSLQSALRRRQLEVDRRELERWLAREVAERTQALEERTNAIADIALEALAAAGTWPNAAEAVQRLAQELGTAPEELTRDIERRRG